MINAFSRLVVLFFGLQRALNDGGGVARLGADDRLVREVCYYQLEKKRLFC